MKIKNYLTFIIIFIVLISGSIHMLIQIKFRLCIFLNQSENQQGSEIML